MVLLKQAVWQFKRYEDASLAYTGVARHAGLEVGLYVTRIILNISEKASMSAVERVGW